MPAPDHIHAAVVAALIADGWTIVKAPPLTLDGHQLFIDLYAERPTPDVLLAVNGPRAIAVEVKSFGTPHPFHQIGAAVGQYDLYRYALGDTSPWQLFLALSWSMWTAFFGETTQLRQYLRSRHVHILVIDPATQEVRTWIEH